MRKPSAGKQRVERRDARKAGAARAELEVVGPEDVGRAGLFGRIFDLRVAHDLRRVLERDLRVEPREQGREEARAGLGPREVEGFEDLFDRRKRRGPHARLVSLATMSRTRRRASSENQKSRNGSWSRAWSKRATAAARERRLIAA